MKAPMIDDYQRSKQHLRLKSRSTPRWLTHVLRRTHPELFRGKSLSTAGVASEWLILNKLLRDADGLFDHFGIDNDYRLVTEPYLTRKEAERKAKAFATKNKLGFSIEPVPFHHPNTVRIVFWPLPEWNLDLRIGRVRKACAEQGGFGMVIVGATQDKDARDEQ